jgi:hypothetical protein
MFKLVRLRNKILLGIAGVVLLLGLTVIIFAKTVLFDKLWTNLKREGYP